MLAACYISSYYFLVKDKSSKKGLIKQSKAATMLKAIGAGVVEAGTEAEAKAEAVAVAKAEAKVKAAAKREQKEKVR